MRANLQQVGKRGEDIAVSYLRSQKFEILERNFRARGGEVDIIARDGNDIVFVEVKTRFGDCFGRASEAVDRVKQQRLVRAALFYLSRQSFKNENYRFDVVTIEVDRNRETFEDAVISHYRNAFLIE